MKFLVDNQLPLALARMLAAQGLECSHVMELGLDEADDLAIWNHAIAHGFVLITKDEDFFHLANQVGTAAPLVWIRLGNCRKATLLSAFAAVLPQLIQTLDAGQRIVEVR